jgi:hypothetical protein
MVVYDEITHPGCLEALACRETLTLTADLPVSEVIVATDCLEVDHGLHDKYYGQFSHILQEICVTARACCRISFCHERRASNEKRTD